MRPLWGLGLTLDRDLTVVLLFANLLFAFFFSLSAFRRRPKLDRLFIVLGLFLTLCVLSLAGLYLFAATPIREVQFFLIDESTHFSYRASPSLLPAACRVGRVPK